MRLAGASRPPEELTSPPDEPPLPGVTSRPLPTPRSAGWPALGSVSTSGEQLTLADRLEIGAARAIAALPAAVKRRIAGEPIRRDGLELDLDMQVLLKLEDRNPRPPLSSGDPAQARKDLRHAV